jgi:hypothetical protein
VVRGKHVVVKKQKMAADDDELFEEYINVEDDTDTTEVDQGTAVITFRMITHGSMLTDRNELLVAADELVKNGEPC